LLIESFVKTLEYFPSSENVFQAAIGVAISIVVILLTPNLWKARRLKARYELIQKVKNAEKANTRAKLRETDRINEISKLSASQLIDALANKKVKSEELVKHFYTVAMESHSKYNCLNDVFLDRALQMAKKADEELIHHGNLLGPLHGLPISIKDCFAIEGTDSTIGVGSKAMKPKAYDSTIVQLLKKAGAIPFIKTNNMQMLMGYESNNPLWGAVKNPNDILRTSGGSSGGEACLVSNFGSPLGIGTDIGGSIRAPSHFCGVCGFKPTGRRISSFGQEGYGAGQESIVDSAGPIARTVDDLILVSKVILSEAHSQIDPAVPCLPWNEELFHTSRKLKFGYFKNDGYIESFSACERAVEIAVNKLKELGHEVVSFSPPKVDEAEEIYISLMSGDGFGTFQEETKDDLIEESLKGIVFLQNMHRIPRRLLAGFFRYILGWKRVSGLLLCAGSKSAKQLWNLQRQRAEYRRLFFSKWKEEKIDCMLSPAFSTVAFPHGYQRVLPHGIGSYLMLYNLLDCPAGVVPITKVTAEDVKIKRQRKDFIDYFLQKSEANSEGLPVGVQVAALPFQDELCLRALKILFDS